MPTVLLTHTPDMLANYYGDRALSALRGLCDVRLNDTGRVLDPGELAKLAEGCDIIVSDRLTAGPAEFFAQAPASLAAFLRVAVDIRNIDVAAASKAGILVTHATPGFIASVAEQTIGFMIDLGRHVSRYTAEYRAGLDPQPQMGRQLAGATLGILGYGAIGHYLARLGVAFGMKVMVSDPFKTINDPGIAQGSFEDVLAASDFLVCLVIANDETENLMNAAAFARMKTSAFFINMSRGNLVDEQALENALNRKQIAGAAMDVGRAPDQKPSLFLAKRPDAVATPHTAGLTPDAAEHQAFDTVNQVRDILAGKIPPGAANADTAHRLRIFAK
ncbi:NAD(P)-dependent oxidoreductase [Undibacter mobilis]|uniref:Hydroxyacid dehydrogenase n=1 Tax=Undibacter mobilis TaxID=2292256 RepID=A0A371B2Q1_9BRAD|nr:NAD(P)-dependent oxidoreductase [Undibacter mobilis]RDV01812.1 hydroxyacid dehydrogenase [Undibacter mobilis]